MSKDKGISESTEIDGFVNTFDLVRPSYEIFTQKLKVLIEDLLKDEGIRFQIVECRTKELKSFREKISRSNKNYSHPLAEITDLSGLRIILYYLEDVELVCDLVKREFNVNSESSIDKGDLLQPNEFGYRSVHFVASLKSDRKALREWRACSDLVAEIQIRTILQHAWAAISHALDYKHEVDVPSASRRQLFRLSGLLELSDEQFSLLRRQRDSLSQQTAERIDKGDITGEINIVTVGQYIEESDDLIPFISKTAKYAGFRVDNWSQDIDYDPVSDISEIVLLCRLFEIDSLQKLDETLKSTKNWAADYLAEQMERGGGGVWEADAAFIIQLLLMRLYPSKISVEYLLNRGWHEEIATRVVEVARSAPSTNIVEQ